MDIYVHIENCERERERERERVVLGELIRDVDHPLREHELSGEPFTSFGAFQFRGMANVELFRRV